MVRGRRLELRRALATLLTKDSSLTYLPLDLWTPSQLTSPAVLRSDVFPDPMTEPNLTRGSPAVMAGRPGFQQRVCAGQHRGPWAKRTTSVRCFKLG